MTEMTQTLAAMRQSIQRKLHATNASGPLVSAIDKAVNDAYARIMSHHEWIWAQAEGAMLTYAPLSEADGGTLTVAGAGNIRLDAAVPAGIDDVGNGWLVQGVVRRSIVSQGTGGSDGQLTLAVGWPNTDAVTDYDLYCIAYNPSTLAIGKVNSVLVESDTTQTELEYQTTPDFQTDYLDTLSTGTPEHYTILKYSTLGYPMFSFGPIPDEQYQITFRYQRRALALVNDTDVPIIPPQWHNILEEGALADIYGSFAYDSYQAARHDAVFQRGLRQMMSESQGTTQVVHYLGGKPTTYDWDKVDPRG